MCVSDSPTTDQVFTASDVTLTPGKDNPQDPLTPGKDNSQDSLTSRKINSQDSLTPEKDNSQDSSNLRNDNSQDSDDADNSGPTSHTDLSPLCAYSQCAIEYENDLHIADMKAR